MIATSAGIDRPPLSPIAFAPDLQQRALTPIRSFGRTNGQRISFLPTPSPSSTRICTPFLPSFPSCCLSPSLISRVLILNVGLTSRRRPPRQRQQQQRAFVSFVDRRQRGGRRRISCRRCRHQQPSRVRGRHAFIALHCCCRRRRPGCPPPSFSMTRARIMQVGVTPRN